MSGPNLGHKNVERFSRVDRLRYFDQLERGVLARVLANDPVFSSKAEAVGAAPTEQRRDVAVHEARAYARNSKQHREAIVRLLLRAADAPWKRYVSQELSPETVEALRCDTLAAEPAEWDVSVTDDDARRVRPRFGRLKRGAERLRCRAAGICIGDGCETKLARSNGDVYCSSCANRFRRARNSHSDEIRDALDAAAGRRPARRAARRKRDSCGLSSQC